MEAEQITQLSVKLGIPPGRIKLVGNQWCVQVKVADVVGGDFPDSFNHPQIGVNYDIPVTDDALLNPLTQALFHRELRIFPKSGAHLSNPPSVVANLEQLRNGECLYVYGTQRL